MISNVNNITLLCHQVTLATCVVIALLAPLTVVANALILVAIWKNPSLRTPSYVLLAGLAFTDFCTGLLSEPFYAIPRFVVKIEKRKLYCDAGLVADSTACVLFFCTYRVLS